MGAKVSDTDSFINEVTEEVRRDQLYGYLRKYGWIAAVAVVAIVGTAAYVEYSKATAAAEAQAVGDGILDALAADNVADRAVALAAIEVDGPAFAVSALMTAAAQQESGDLAAAKSTLEILAVNQDVPEVYRDVAGFKSALIVLPDGDMDARRATLDGLSLPGAPFRLLALEQIAQMDVAAGDVDAAVATFRAIIEDAAVSRGLRERAQSMIVALGADIEPSVAEE
jgi:hypothetical protein